MLRLSHFPTAVLFIRFLMTDHGIFRVNNLKEGMGMEAKTLFDFYRYVRANTLQLLENVTEEALDVIPDGHNNSIRWNAGHILVSETFFFGAFLKNAKAKEYVDLFKMGTSPRQYVKNPPHISEIKQLLKDQQDELLQALEGHLEDVLPKPITIQNVELKTVKDIVHFSLYHEGLHQGVINSLRKTVSTNR
jgi:uncharacterized damage-inducible protein DinB